MKKVIFTILLSLSSLVNAVTNDVLEFKDGITGCKDPVAIKAILDHAIKDIQSKVEDSYDFIAPTEWIEHKVVEGKYMCLCIVLYKDYEGPAYNVYFYEILKINPNTKIF